MLALLGERADDAVCVQLTAEVHQLERYLAGYHGNGGVWSSHTRRDLVSFFRFSRDSPFQRPARNDTASVRPAAPVRHFFLVGGRCL